jgi:hypothetical protein
MEILDCYIIVGWRTIRKYPLRGANGVVGKPKLGGLPFSRSLGLIGTGVLDMFATIPLPIK